MTPPARAVLAAALLALLAACGGGDDDGRGAVPNVPARAVDEAGRLVLTPAESAAAADDARARSRTVHGEAGGLGLAPPEPAPGTPAPRTHADCMADARRASGEGEREVLARACRHLPGAP